MKKCLAALVVMSGLIFGAASYIAVPFQTAVLWAVGGGVATASTVVVAQRIVCRNGTVLELSESKNPRGQITFVKPGGKVYGPYDRT